MDLVVRIPDDLAQRLGSVGELEQRALEALAIEEYRLGHLTKPELRRLLGFGTSDALDGFLKAHDVHESHSPEGAEREDLKQVVPGEAARTKARQAAANIIARRKGVTLGGLKIKDLINEGRR
jgi:hypothetical protein